MMMHLQRRGKDGKFQRSSEGSSCTTEVRRGKKRVTDGSWIVTSSVPEGPIDGSLLFLVLVVML